MRARILAAHMVSVYEESIGKTATNLMQSERWVRDWLKRYDEGGLDGPPGSSPAWQAKSNSPRDS